MDQQKTQVEQLWSLSLTEDTLPAMTPGKLLSDQHVAGLSLREMDLDPKSEKKADFQILEVIGKGGMGTVYAAQQTSLDRRIALKHLRPELAHDAKRRNQFIAEAAVTSILNHPNIPPIYELGLNKDGAPLYAMEEVTGFPWSDIMYGPARFTTSVDGSRASKEDDDTPPTFSHNLTAQAKVADETETSASGRITKKNEQASISQKPTRTPRYPHERL